MPCDPKLIAQIRERRELHQQVGSPEWAALYAELLAILSDAPMQTDLRQLLEDVRHRAAAINDGWFTRSPLVIEAAKARDAQLASTVDLQSYLDRIDSTLAGDVSPFEQAALSTAKAWFLYWNGGTMIERHALPRSTDQVESIEADAVISAVDVAIAKSGDPAGWDNVEKRAI